MISSKLTVLDLSDDGQALLVLGAHELFWLFDAWAWLLEWVTTNV